MDIEKSNTCSESGDQFPAQHEKGIEWGFALFLVLGVIALLLPSLSIPFVGVYGAAVVAVIVLVVWFTVMPTTCMGGGFICSLVALAILGSTLGIVLIAIARFIVSLFT